MEHYPQWKEMKTDKTPLSIFYFLEKAQKLLFSLVVPFTVDFIPWDSKRNELLDKNFGTAPSVFLLRLSVSWA